MSAEVLTAAIYKARWVDGIRNAEMVTDEAIAKAAIEAGFRQIFDGDCGLSNISDESDREAAEAWMRWANLVNIPEGGNGIAAMKQMLAEFGYKRVTQ